MCIESFLRVQVFREMFKKLRRCFFLLLVTAGETGNNTPVDSRSVFSASRMSLSSRSWFAFLRCRSFPLGFVATSAFCCSFDSRTSQNRKIRILKFNINSSKEMNQPRAENLCSKEKSINSQIRSRTFSKLFRRTEKCCRTLSKLFSDLPKSVQGPSQNWNTSWTFPKICSDRPRSFTFQKCSVCYLEILRCLSRKMQQASHKCSRTFKDVFSDLPSSVPWRVKGPGTSGNTSVMDFKHPREGLRTL